MKRSALTLHVAAERSKRHKLGRVHITSRYHADGVRRAWPGPFRQGRG